MFATASKHILPDSPRHSRNTLLPPFCQSSLSRARWLVIISSNSTLACEGSKVSLPELSFNSGGELHAEHVQTKSYLNGIVTLLPIKRGREYTKRSHGRSIPLTQDISSGFSIRLSLARHPIAVSELLSSGNLPGGNRRHPPPIKVHPGKVGQAGVVEQGEGGVESRAKGPNLANDSVPLSLLHQHLAQPVVIARQTVQQVGHHPGKPLHILRHSCLLQEAQ